MSLSTLDTASFGQSFSPYTNNQSLPLQQPPFPVQAQPGSSFAHNVPQQQQYPQLSGGKSLERRQCGCACADMVGFDQPTRRHIHRPCRLQP